MAGKTKDVKEDAVFIQSMPGDCMAMMDMLITMLGKDVVTYAHKVGRDLVVEVGHELTEDKKKFIDASTTDFNEAVRMAMKALLAYFQVRSDEERRVVFFDNMLHSVSVVIQSVVEHGEDHAKWIGIRDALRVEVKAISSDRKTIH